MLSTCQCCVAFGCSRVALRKTQEGDRYLSSSKLMVASNGMPFCVELLHCVCANTRHSKQVGSCIHVWVAVQALP